MTEESRFWIKDEQGRYIFKRPASETQIINLAKKLLRKELYKEPMSSPAMAASYLQTKISKLEHEEFHALYLCTRHYPIADECITKGTLNGATVHPREVVKRALYHNASAVIFSHNHPSGIAEPSQSDLTLTKRLREALELVEIRVLDHLVIGGDEFVSMSDQGLI